MNKAIFLDRDGVLVDNSEHYYIWKSDQLKLVNGTIENLKLLIQKGFQLFIISNQGGISRGLCTKDDILKLHSEMIQILKANNIEITQIAFCPHHPEIEKCLCRKPDSLMIEKLMAKYKISKTDSYLIGDRKLDMDAAEKAGICGIQITPNQNMFPYISSLIQ